MGWVCTLQPGTNLRAQGVPVPCLLFFLFFGWASTRVVLLTLDPARCRPRQSRPAGRWCGCGDLERQRTGRQRGQT